MEVATVERKIAVAARTDAAPPAPAGPRSPVLERLHALVRKGYRPELGKTEEDGILVLRHLGRAPDLVLHPDGSLSDLDARRPRFKRDIELGAPIGSGPAAEDLRFMKFLETVPKARMWDRTRQWRKKYLYFPLVLAVAWGISIALTAMIIGG